MSVEYMETPRAVELSKRLREWTGQFKEDDADGYAYPKILWIGEHLFLVKTVGYNYDGHWHSPQVQLRRVDSPEAIGKRGAGDGYAHGWSGRDCDVVMVIKRSPGSSPSYSDYVGQNFDGPCGPLTSDVLFGLIELARDADRRWEAEEAEALAARKEKLEAQERETQAQDALKAAREEVWATKDAVVDAAVAWANGGEDVSDKSLALRNSIIDCVVSYEAALLAVAEAGGEA
jgi:hypothetical protein